MKSNVKSNWQVYVLIVTCVAIVYGQSYNDGYSWDDSLHLHDNINYQRSSLWDLLNFWTTGYFGLYIPVTYTLWGMVLFFFSTVFDYGFTEVSKYLHILNLILYSINCILTYHLFKKIFTNQINTLFATLIYVLHPINSETVLWISELRGLLAIFFVLIALNLLFGQRSRNWLIILLVLIGVLSKPSVLVVIGIVIGFWFLKGGNSKFNYFNSIVLIFLTCVPVIYTKTLQSNDDLGYIPNYLERLEVSWFSISFYIHKFFIPYDYHHIYGMTPQKLLNQNNLTQYFSVILILSLIFYILRDSKLKVLYLLGSYIILISINSGIVPFAFQNYSTVANRYASLGLLPMIIAFVLLLSKIPNMRLRIFILIAFLSLNVHQSYQQVIDWSHQGVLWEKEALRNRELLLVQQNWYNLTPSSSKKLGIAYLNYIREDKTQEDVKKLVESLLAFDKFDLAKLYFKENFIVKDSLYFDLKADLEFASGDYDEALKSYTAAIQNRFTTPLSCVKFFTIAIYLKGKSQVLERLNSCPYNSEYGPLKAFKRKAEEMLEEFPDPRRENINYAFTEQSKVALEKGKEIINKSGFLMFKRYFKDSLDIDYPYHQSVFKFAIKEAFEYGDLEFAELVMNQYMFYFKRIEDDFIYEAARLYLKNEDYIETYIKLISLIVMDSKYKESAMKYLKLIEPYLDGEILAFNKDFLKSLKEMKNAI